MSATSPAYGLRIQFAWNELIFVPQKFVSLPSRATLNYYYFIIGERTLLVSLHRNRQISMSVSRHKQITHLNDTRQFAVVHSADAVPLRAASVVHKHTERMHALQVRKEKMDECDESNNTWPYLETCWTYSTNVFHTIQYSHSHSSTLLMCSIRSSYTLHIHSLTHTFSHGQHSALCARLANESKTIQSTAWIHSNRSIKFDFAVRFSLFTFHISHFSFSCTAGAGAGLCGNVNWLENCRLW